MCGAANPLILLAGWVGVNFTYVEHAVYLNSMYMGSLFKHTSTNKHTHTHKYTSMYTYIHNIYIYRQTDIYIFKITDAASVSSQI